MKYIILKLKSHADLWWDNLQLCRLSLGKSVSDFKGEFDPGLFIYSVHEVEKYHEMLGIEKDGPKR
jgi:hypothetical protein